MPYIAPEVVTEAKRMDLLTYLRTYEPGQLVRVSGNTYCKIIAIVRRKDGIEEKWVVVPDGVTFSKEEIRRQIHFQEQYFDSEIVM